MTPLLHPETEAEIRRLADVGLPHALLLTGDDLADIQAAAQWLGREIGAEVRQVAPSAEKGTIATGRIRELYTATAHRGERPLVVIMSAAETMTLDAQHAFLKLLEEPTSRTHFVLLSQHAATLIPTVHSRVQTFHIRPITPEQTERLLDQLAVREPARRQQLRFMAAGRPARLTMLARDDDAFGSQAELLRRARTVIGSRLYDALTTIHSLKSDRAAALELVEAMIQLLKYDISQRRRATPDITRRFDRLEVALTRLRGSGNLRLVLARSVL